MKTVKAILTHSPGYKKYRKGYLKGYTDGKELGAILVAIPSILIIGVLIALLVN